MNYVDNAVSQFRALLEEQIARSERMRDAAPDLVVSINASPSHTGKRE